jgi:MFS family permease
MWRQPKAVWAVAFACVIAFMGIGLVDPILKPIADQLNATPSQVSLLFTSYMAVMGVAMLVTDAVASRIGAKRTLLIGLVVIIAGAALAGSSDTVMGIVGWRALWGLGNVLFIATALSTIVSSARGSVAQAVILYEAALGLGIAVGPLVGGFLGAISWRGPFYGVSTLMAIALVVTALALPATPRAPRPTSLLDPFRALRHRGLLGVAITALLYNFGFFTLLAFTPFPLDMGAHEIGLIFFRLGRRPGLHLGRRGPASAGALRHDPDPAGQPVPCCPGFSSSWPLGRTAREFSRYASSSPACSSASTTPS